MSWFSSCQGQVYGLRHLHKGLGDRWLWLQPLRGAHSKSCLGPATVVVVFRCCQVSRCGLTLITGCEIVAGWGGGSSPRCGIPMWESPFTRYMFGTELWSPALSVDMKRIEHGLSAFAFTSGFQHGTSRLLFIVPWILCSCNVPHNVQGPFSAHRWHWSVGSFFESGRAFWNSSLSGLWLLRQCTVYSIIHNTENMIVWYCMYSIWSK